jgi:hypothetical protein
MTQTFEVVPNAKSIRNTGRFASDYSSLPAAAVSQLPVNLFGRAQSDRRKSECRIGRRPGRKDARSCDEEIFVIVATAPAIHHRIFWVLPHDAGAHDVRRGVPIERSVWLYRGLGLRQGGIHQLENSRSCPCRLRINLPGSPVDRHRGKKFLVTPSKPVVQTHVTCSGHLPLLCPRLSRYIGEISYARSVSPL